MSRRRLRTAAGYGVLLGFLVVDVGLWWDGLRWGGMADDHPSVAASGLAVIAGGVALLVVARERTSAAAARKAGTRARWGRSGPSPRTRARTRARR